MFNKEDVDPTCEDFEAQERVFRDEMRDEMGGDDRYDAYDIVPEPGTDELVQMAYTGKAMATDGCEVEPDGHCEHGSPSWLVHLGYL